VLAVPHPLLDKQHRALSILLDGKGHQGHERQASGMLIRVRERSKSWSSRVF
jgi:hypothetical protein